MANITFLRPTYIDASTIKLSGDTLDTTMALAKKYLGDGSARWTAAAVVANLPDKPGQVAVLEEVASLTGGAPTGLDGLLLGPIPLGRMFEVLIAGEVVTRRYKVVSATGETADGDGIISPPDFDATGCNKYLLKIQ